VSALLGPDSETSCEETGLALLGLSMLEWGDNLMELLEREKG